MVLRSYNTSNFKFESLQNTIKPGIFTLNTVIYSITANSYVKTQSSSDLPIFRIQCNSNGLVLPTRLFSNSRNRRKRDDLLPSILQSLESDDDVEKALNLYTRKLTPKEQSVILKEQRSPERVIRVFEWMKSQKDYLPNGIHYNIVLRTLGKAQKWDVLRIYWIEMAKNAVLPTNKTYAMLVDVYAKAGLVKEALLWIKHMRGRGIFPDEVSMNTVIRVLKEEEEFDRANKFYKDWCIGQVDLENLELESDISNSEYCLNPISLKQFLSTELFKTGCRVHPRSDNSLESIPRKPQMTATYNTLIDLYGKAGRLKDAAAIFCEMLSSGVTADRITFNTMIYTCGSHGHLSEAELLLGKMEQRGIFPDTTTYNIFLSLYAKAGKIDAALDFYKRIRVAGLFPDSVTHRAVFEILTGRRMTREIECIIGEMERENIDIHETSLPLLVRFFVNEGAMDSAKLLFERHRLVSRFCSNTYAAIIDVFGEKGLLADAESMFYMERDIGFHKLVVEYNVMIKAYGMAKLYNKALYVFKSMKDQGVWPDECTYNSLIQMLSGADLTNQAVDVLSEMRGVGFKPHCLTLSSIIAAFSRKGEVSNAVNVYQEMLGMGIDPNEIVYGSLINGFVEQGNLEDARWYFHAMKERGISPNVIILTSLMKGYGKVGSFEGAKALYNAIKGSDLNVIALNTMISVYAYSGMVSEAEGIFCNLRDKGLADNVSYISMISLYKSMGMLREAVNTADAMKNLGFVRDCSSFNRVMSCYASDGQLGRCGELLHEMMACRVSPDEESFRVAYSILKKGGFPDEGVEWLDSTRHEKGLERWKAVVTCVFSLIGLHELALGLCETLSRLRCGWMHNVIVYAYSLAGEADGVFEIFMKFQKNQSLRFESFALVSLVGCFARAEKVEGLNAIHAQIKCGRVDSEGSLIKALRDGYIIACQPDLARLLDLGMNDGFGKNDDTSEDGSSASHCL